MIPRAVSIMGCGWLGFPLAEVLLKEGFKVKGSTTRSEKVPVLQKAGIFSFRLKGDPELEGEGIEDFFNADTVVITVPFRRGLPDPRFYQRQIHSIVKRCEESPQVGFVIFTSSTSVYPAHIPVAVEAMAFHPDHPRARVLCDIERDILTNKNFEATVVRCAGLYGGERKIGRFLAGQDNLAGGMQSVNLIHRDDAVGIIVEIIRQDVRGEIFNACSDRHPARRELYTAAARAMGLQPPGFADETETLTKIVSNEKVKARLGYHFLHPDPMGDV